MRNLLRRRMFAAALEAAEKEIYLAAYEHSKYNQVKAAKLLGVSRGTFISRLKEWRMNAITGQLTNAIRESL